MASNYNVRLEGGDVAKVEADYFRVEDGAVLFFKDEQYPEKVTVDKISRKVTPIAAYNEWVSIRKT